MAQVGCFVPASAVFSDTQADMPTFVRLLSKLSLGDVIFHCGRINHVLSTASDLTHGDRQAFGLHMLFTPEERQAIERFAQTRSGSVAVFFRGSLLEIVRWAVLVCQNHPNDGVTFNDAELRRTFAKAVLVANKIWGDRGYGDALNLDKGVAAARERSIGPLRKGVEGSLIAPRLEHSLARGWRIFDGLLPLRDSAFAGRFSKATGLAIEDYYACWCACVTQFAKGGCEAIIFNADKLGQSTQDPALVQRFVELESQSFNDLRRALWGNREVSEILDGSVPFYDYKPLREKPILRADDGRAIIIDPCFMADRAAAGPLFHALNTCAERREANQLFSAFGSAFETYVQEILRRAFPKPRNGLVDPLSLSLQAQSCSGEHFEIDACINYITDLVLFEVKGTWVREGELAPEQGPSLLESLKRQYGASDEVQKGAGQLANVVNAIAARKWLGPEGEFDRANRIVPVLAVHDVLLAAPGFGAFVASEFDRALNPDDRPSPNERIKGSLRVLAPIVLTVEDLEVLESSVEHFSLREALIDYSDAYPDRMISFRHFLATSPIYSGQIYPNRHLASTAMESLRIAMERLFAQSRAPENSK